jgi:ketosteroid isomerase-like protein
MMRNSLAAVLAAMTLAAGSGVGPVVAQSAVILSESHESSEAEEIAREYVSAYSAADWDAMALLMADDFVFMDRTSPVIGGEEFDKDGTLAMLEEYETRGRIVGLFLDFPRVFSSNGVVVFSGHVNALSLTSDPDYGVRWRAEQVLIVTVRDGQVVRHDDYANYAQPVISRERLEADQ